MSKNNEVWQEDIYGKLSLLNESIKAGNYKTTKTKLRNAASRRGTSGLRNFKKQVFEKSVGVYKTADIPKIMQPER